MGVLLTAQVIVTIMLLQVVHSFPVLRRISTSKRHLSVIAFNDRKVVRLSDMMEENDEIAERSISWISKDHVKHDFKADVPEDSFKVISYNVLGPWQGQSNMHYYAPHSVTNWKHRKNALCDHIVELNADLVCLQEVSSYSLKKVFQSSLRKVGYELVGYSPARKHGHQPPTHNLHETIGSAIFMKLQKFDVVERRRILLRDFAGPVLGDEAATGEPSVHSKLLSNFRSKHQSMQIARLRVKATDQQFVIATTHLCWNPDQTDVKLLQAFAATQALRAFMAKQNLDQVATGHKHTKYGSTDAQDEEEDLADEAENEERATPDEDESPDPPVHSVEVTPAASSSNAAADEALHLLSPEEIDAFVASIPLIFCGDFNSFPNVEDESASASTNIPPSSSPSTIRSGVMQLLSSGSVPSSHPHHPNQWREMLRQKIVNAAAAASATTTTTATAATATETSPTTEQQTTQSTSPAQSVDPLSLSLPSLQQPFKLKNIYEIEPFTQYQPRFSTKTDAFQGWIDHMWCSSHFTVEMVLRLPVTTKESEEEAKNFPPIPTKAYPSDHLPVGAVFRLNL